MLTCRGELVMLRNFVSIENRLELTAMVILLRIVQAFFHRLSFGLV